MTDMLDTLMFNANGEDVILPLVPELSTPDQKVYYEDGFDNETGKYLEITVTESNGMYSCKLDTGLVEYSSAPSPSPDAAFSRAYEKMTADRAKAELARKSNKFDDIQPVLGKSTKSTDIEEDVSY